jgi:hypothetical protein
MKRACLALLLAALVPVSASTQQNSARVEAVRNYILSQDYPEVFGSTNYKTKIEGFLDADVDNDGQPEVVILFHPHYRQSAPILIYKVTSDLRVSRVAEGLAPGPLQLLSGDYLDSHNLGQAADFEIQSEKTSPEAALNLALKTKMNGFVVYDAFYHMDGRKGLPYLIDMRGSYVPSGRHDCDNFEFSRVKQIAAGHLKEDAARNYLAAWVGDEIYVYLITGVTDVGLLNKKKWVSKVPSGFEGFLPEKGLTYKTAAGTETLALK